MKTLFCGLVCCCLLVGVLFGQSDAPGPMEADSSSGLLRLPEGGWLNVVCPDGSQREVRAENGQAALPHGKYRVHFWTYEKKDADGHVWQLRGYPARESIYEIGQSPVDFTVKPEPIKATPEISWYDGYYFSLNLKGQAGESLYLYRAGKRAKAPQIEVTNTDNSFSKKLALEYG